MATAVPQNVPSSFPLTSADLWVLPPAAQSQWFSQVDWYLNWQLCKGLAFERVKPSVELIRVLEETGISYEEQSAVRASPLMVIAEGRLPAAVCVVVDYPKTLKGWLKSVHKVSQGLKAKSLRIFLPRGATIDAAAEIWQELSPQENAVEFSPDEEMTP